MGRFVQADTLIPSEETDNTLLIVDYHEQQFIDQQNKIYNQISSDQPTKSITVPSNSQSFDRYSYASNNSIRYNDPTGHRNCEEDGYNCSDDKPPFDNHLGGNTAAENSQEKTSSDNPNYEEVLAGAGLLFVTEAVGIGLSVAAGILAAPAGPEVAVPALFTVYIAYHEQTAPIFVIGFFMIYDGLTK